MKRIAIIPARGGSKRIKRKNLKLFYDKPIILYTIELLKNSNIFSKIHISTEDSEIFDVARSVGHEPDFKRPKSLSTDNVNIIDVMDYVINKYDQMRENFDQIWLVYACNPLLENYQIIDAKNVFEKKCSDTALLAIKETTPYSKLLTINTHNKIKPIDNKNFQKVSQKLMKTYIDAGSFAIFSTKFFKETNSKFFPNNFYGYRLNKSNSIDIDDQDDWELAEAMYYLKNKNKKEKK